MEWRQIVDDDATAAAAAAMYPKRKWKTLVESVNVGRWWSSEEFLSNPRTCDLEEIWRHWKIELVGLEKKVWTVKCVNLSYQEQAAAIELCLDIPFRLRNVSFASTTTDRSPSSEMERFLSSSRTTFNLHLTCSTVKVHFGRHRPRLPYGQSVPFNRHLPIWLSVVTHTP